MRTATRIWLLLAGISFVVFMVCGSFAALAVDDRIFHMLTFQAAVSLIVSAIALVGAGVSTND